VDGESLKDERSQLWSAAYTLLLEIERRAPELGSRQVAWGCSMQHALVGGIELRLSPRGARGTLSVAAHVPLRHSS
jgi:hypothetical protein